MGFDKSAAAAVNSSGMTLVDGIANIGASRGLVDVEIVGSTS